MLNNMQLGETRFYEVDMKNDCVVEYICHGYAEHLVWDWEREEYTPAVFWYGKNDKTESFCFLVHPHPAYKYTQMLGKDVFFSYEEAVKELENRKSAEETVVIGNDINDFAKKRTRRRRR